MIIKEYEDGSKLTPSMLAVAVVVPMFIVAGGFVIKDWMKKKYWARHYAKINKQLKEDVSTL